MVFWIEIGKIKKEHHRFKENLWIYPKTKGNETL